MLLFKSLLGFSNKWFFFSIILVANFLTSNQNIMLFPIIFEYTDVESHHQRIRTDRAGTTYSPERLDNESPGE